MDITTTTTATTTTDTNDDVPYDTYYDDDSNCSTPYVSAPSSPRHHLPSRFFFYSAPTSPMHFVLSSSSSAAAKTTASPPSNHDASNAFEFQLSSRVDSPSASSADELFLNGQIRPLHLTLQNDVVLERSRESNLRDKSQRRRTRSMSPSRNTPPPTDVTSSASSSRCSSAGRSSKRWLFLKDFLRSKSEGSSNNKFWNNINVSFSKEKEKKRTKKSSSSSPSISISTAGKRRSAHEMHYAANRAQAEEMRKKTYLPYRQGLLGCLGFNSKSYGAFHAFTRPFNPVSST